MVSNLIFATKVPPWSSQLFTEALKSHKLGGVIVDVGLWGFLEVLYRPTAAIGAGLKPSLNVEIHRSARPPAQCI